MKTEILYNDKEITLEKFEDRTYRVTFFDEHNHWAGDFTFDKNGIKYDDLTEKTSYIDNGHGKETKGKQAPIEYDYVDLDLPSGLKWATCNVGAENPWEYGKYFAWGDTKGYYDNEEHDFSWKNYKWCNGTYDTLTNYNNDSTCGLVDNKLVLDLEDDAAHVNMGGDWRMPTHDEMEELIDNTDHNWVKNYQGTGVNGRLFASRKDSSKSIFIPASGYCWDSSVNYQGSDAGLWGSTLYTDNPNGAWRLGFSSDDCYVYNYGRYGGFCVRGVKN